LAAAVPQGPIERKVQTEEAPVSQRGQRLQLLEVVVAVLKPLKMVEAAVLAAVQRRGIVLLAR
jgi:hypothetical protein